MICSTGLGKTIIKMVKCFCIEKSTALNSNLEQRKPFLHTTTKMIFATGKTKPVLFCISWKIKLLRNKYSLMAFTARITTTKMNQLTTL